MDGIRAYEHQCDNNYLLERRKNSKIMGDIRASTLFHHHADIIHRSVEGNQSNRLSYH